MTTVLEKTLKREVEIDDQQYTLTISPDGLKLVPKGRRNGVELQWRDLVSGQAALAVALNASLERLSPPPARESKPAVQAPAETNAVRPERPRRERRARR